MHSILRYFQNINAKSILSKLYLLYKCFFFILLWILLFCTGAPTFHSKFLVLSARRGDKCNIECTPNGDRPMRFTWRRNGQIIDPTNEAR